MTEPKQIALIDDDRNIVTSLSLFLQTEGFKIITAHDGEAGYALIQKEKPDLAILDIKMPRMDGIELLKNLRKNTEMPIIMLTSKDDEIDQISGLESGADDYVTKPFSQKLLLARIQTLIRRVSQSNVIITDSDLIIRGDLSLNESKHEISWQDKPVVLTVSEYLMVKSLALKPGHVRTRDQLINDSYGESIYIDDRTVDTHIKRIRKKFREADPHFDAIETLYGVGYRYKEQ